MHVYTSASASSVIPVPPPGPRAGRVQRWGLRGRPAPSGAGRSRLPCPLVPPVAASDTRGPRGRGGCSGRWLLPGRGGRHSMCMFTHQRQRHQSFPFPHPGPRAGRVGGGGEMSGKGGWVGGEGAGSCLKRSCALLPSPPSPLRNQRWRCFFALLAVTWHLSLGTCRAATPTAGLRAPGTWRHLSLSRAHAAGLASPARPLQYDDDPYTVGVVLIWPLLIAYLRPCRRSCCGTRSGPHDLEDG